MKHIKKINIMTQYIDKDALVAEIERRTKAYQENFDKADNKIAKLFANGLIQGLESFLAFLDTFEVKEVKEEPVSNDFEEEYDNYTKHILACDVQFKPFTHLYNCAKYFFELGLKAKGE